MWICAGLLVFLGWIYDLSLGVGLGEKASLLSRKDLPGKERERERERGILYCNCFFLFFSFLSYFDHSP